MIAFAVSMALFSEDLSQLETKFSKTDGINCTSSNGVSEAVVGATEDNDELRLGAEANSFDKSNGKEEKLQFAPTNKVKKSRKNKCDNLIIMKQVYCSVENLETDVRYSAISSVEDIFDARECDPDEVLTSLGFANCFDEMNKKDILSRFKGSPLLNNKDNQYFDAMLNNRADHYEHTKPVRYKDGIHKAEEWLAMHHDDNNQKDFAMANQNSASNTTGKKSTNRSGKWKRFPKSRQSSFELLLPNLTEEDNQSVVASGTKKTDLFSTSDHPTIRESSLELPLADHNEADRVQRNERQSTSPDRLPSIISLMNKEGSHQPVQLHITHEVEETGHAGTIEKNDEERKLNRLLKSSLLITNQRDSFELEEINSCNGDPIEPTRQRRSGVTFLTIDSGKRNGAEHSHSPNSEGGSDENESSSGFGEDDGLNLTNLNHPNHLKHHVSPHTVVESIQKKKYGSSSIPSSAVNTHYVYDVELGGNRKANETRKPHKVDPNLNNNARGANCDEPRLDPSLRRCQSSGSLMTNYVPLKSSGSWHGFGKIPNGYVVTPLSKTSESDHTGIRKSRSFFSDARRRRKEFAEKSALSGDSITELVSTALVRHNGGFSVKKRRAGHFRYYTSTNDLFPKENSPDTHNFQRFNLTASNNQKVSNASNSFSSNRLVKNNQSLSSETTLQNPKFLRSKLFTSSALQ